MKPLAEKVAVPADASFRCWRRVDDRFGFMWHVHPEYELTLIVRSRGRRFVGDCIENYGDGDLVLLGSNLPHTWDSDSTVKGRRHEAVVVQFSEEALVAPLRRWPEAAAIGRLLDRAGRGLHVTDRSARAVRPMLAVMPEQPPPARLWSLLLILDMLSRAKDLRPLASRSMTSHVEASDQRRIDKVCHYLNAHLDESVSLVRLASLVHMAPGSLSRYFRRTTGLTLPRYVNELRIGQACRLLVETELAISRIALRVGYENLSNFNRRFRQLKRMTPGTYRRQFAAE